MTTTQCDYALCSKCKSNLDSKKVSITNDKRQSRRKILGDENKRKNRYIACNERTADCTEECKHFPEELVCLFDGSYFSKERIDSLKDYDTKYPFWCNKCHVHFFDKGSRKHKKSNETFDGCHQYTLV